MTISSSFPDTVYIFCVMYIFLPYKEVVFPSCLMNGNGNNWRSLELVRISNSLLKPGQQDKLLQATICLIYSNTFCSISVHLNLTLLDFKFVEVSNLCERLDHKLR